MPREHLSTKDEILLMLKANGSLTVSEISKELGITEMGVRRHLNTLEQNGLIRSALVRQSMGRPTYIYSLTDKAEDQFPKAYRQLALDLLDVFVDVNGEEKVNEIFERREELLRTRYLPMLSGKTLEEKVDSLLEIQNDKGYMAELDTNEEAFVLKQYNCLISQIAKKYPEACEAERKLFENLLGVDVMNLSCMGQGDRICTFQIFKNQKK
ncbi:helix-turn-helix transcriptional regulator [Tepidibacillus fermentans]|uniref:Putative ArsR family transcriptional regulator n=1 Tax=Tepidibacillus fermentans TaxID=1281767 RepID=A0A4R3KIL6_9BACI|nr:metalloregulator ArsR/SmtB family transcription factor [Tepidibacillus fermentans]TCS83114.1 putative ArsR family transcriptional regulator [Tepidibacillus fermentans]